LRTATGKTNAEGKFTGKGASENGGRSIDLKSPEIFCLGLDEPTAEGGLSYKMGEEIILTERGEGIVRKRRRDSFNKHHHMWRPMKPHLSGSKEKEGKNMILSTENGNQS